MTNAEMATKLVIDFFEAENIMVDTPAITKIINKWEAKLDPIDYISLAAVAISNPNDFAFTKAEIREFREFYFPSENFIERSFF